MQRAPIVLTGTVAGLAATLGFHAHAPATAPPVGTARAATAGTTASAPSSTATAPSKTSASGSVSTTVTSAVEPNQYGNVQLKLTVKAGRITAIDALQLPQGDGKSAQISTYAEPALRQSALTAQSASIDAVSGATYTSAGYKQALQSALDRAGLSAAAGSTS